jgi:ribosomal protein L37E
LVKYCPRCGNASYDSAPKCGNCGYNFAQESTKEESKKQYSIKNQLLSSIKDLGDSTNGKAEKSKPANINKPSFNFKKPDFSSIKLNQPLSKKEELQQKDPIYLTDKEKYELFKSSQDSNIGYKATEADFTEIKQISREPIRETVFKEIVTKETIVEESDVKEPIIKKPIIEETKVKEPIIKKPIINKTKVKKDETKEPDVLYDIKNVLKNEDKKEDSKSSLDFLNKVSRRNIAIFVIIVALLAIIVAAAGLTMTSNTSHVGPGNYSNDHVAFSYPTNWSQYNSTSGNSDQGEVAFRTPDKTVIGFSCINNSEITLDDVKNSINQTAKSLDGKIISVDNITIDGENATDIVINTTGHGYSRYISVIHDGTYYNWVINNGKSDNPYLNATNTAEINKMIESIHFTD